jgi:hypothetical protein
MASFPPVTLDVQPPLDRPLPRNTTILHLPSTVSHPPVLILTLDLHSSALNNSPVRHEPLYQKEKSKNRACRHPLLPFYNWFWGVLIGLGNHDEISLISF